MQIDLKVKHQRIIGVQQVPRLVVEQTTGFVYLNLEFDEEWDLCNITVLFTNDRCSGEPVAVIWRGEPIEVPEEVLVTGVLRISCVGLWTDDQGKTRKRIITKKMAEGIRVHAAGEQTGYEPGSTVPGIWEQALAIMGPLQNLKTWDKSSLVAAINEALARCYGVVGITDITQTKESEEDGGINEWTMTLSNNDKTTLKVRNGRKGNPGYTPVRGKDYWTESDKKDIVGEVLLQNLPWAEGRSF